MAGCRARLRKVQWFQDYGADYDLITVDHEIQSIMEMLGRKRGIPKTAPGYLFVRYADERHDHGNYVVWQVGGDLRDVWADFDHIVPGLNYEVRLIWCASDAEHRIKQKIQKEMNNEKCI